MLLLSPTVVLGVWARVRGKARLGGLEGTLMELWSGGVVVLKTLANNGQGASDGLARLDLISDRSLES